MSNSQHDYWSKAFSGAEFYYGQDAGPVARRAVRYHAPSLAPPIHLDAAQHSMQLPVQNSAPSALDAGCGEGQDLAFLAQCGYRATKPSKFSSAAGASSPKNCRQLTAKTRS